MEKFGIIMIIGIIVNLMTMSASTNENRLEFRTDKINQEGIIISSAPTSEELLIAPNKDTVVEHFNEKSERTIGETIITPDSYDRKINKEILETDELVGSISTNGETISSDVKSLKNNVGTKVVLVVGAVIFLLIVFLFLRKK